MVTYSCERCGKTFDHRGDYGKHLDRKVPCNGGENAPTLLELKDRLQKLENEINKTTEPEPEPEPEPDLNHPVSLDDFNRISMENGAFLYNEQQYLIYREYMMDCLEADDAVDEYSNDVLASWRRKVLFEDLFKNYHVFDVIGKITKKNISLAEYRKLFAKFMEMVYNEDDENNTESDIPEEIANVDTDGTISAFTTMMTRMENSLYSLGVVGTSARDSLIPLVILRLLQDHFESGIIDVMDIEKYKYDDYYITEESINYVLLKNYKDLDAASASILLSNIWQYVLSEHPITSKIFEPGKYVDIRSDVVLLSIINELVAFDFENCSPDNLSIAYQHFIHRQFKGENGSRMGQHFTPDRLIDMMMREYGQYIPTTGKYADPFMGTAGFITAMYNAKKGARTSDTPNEYLCGTEIDPNVFKYAFTNLLVQTGEVCENIKNESAFVNHKDKYSAVFTNPPFGKTIARDEKNKTLKYNLANILNRNLVCLQYCMYIIAPGGICSMVWVNGAECFGTNRAAKEIRKRLFTEFHFLGAIMVPGQKKVFEHAGIKPIILTFRKPIDDEDVVTPSLKIYECNETCETVNFITEIDAEKLEEKDYVISVDAYKEHEQLVVYGNAEIKTLGEVCKFGRGEFITKKDLSGGNYLVIGGGEKPMGKINRVNTEPNTVLISRMGSAGFVSMHKEKVFSTDKIIKLFPKDNAIDNKYLYYYCKYSMQNQINNIIQGAAQPGFNASDLKDLQIPIPSMERQKEIAERIMEWEESLRVNEEAIMHAEFDIHRIMSKKVPLGSNIEIKSLEEVCEFRNGTRITKKEITDGLYPVYGGGDSHYNHNNYNRDDETLIISRFGVSEECVRIVKGKIFLNDSAISIHSKFEGLTQSYLKYYAKYVLEKHIYDTCRGSAQKNINIKEVSQLPVHIPSVEKQKEVSRILDKITDHKKRLEDHGNMIMENMPYELQDL